jgi:dephospho-CoA kinase
MRFPNCSKPGPEPLLIGLTGGIATGKSTVLAMFRELGAETLSADDIARDLMRPGAELHNAVVQAFGCQYLLPTGEIDRGKLGHLIFTNPDARQRLDAITHPPILKQMAGRVAQLRASGRQGPFVLEIPLLYEANARSMVHRVVLVASEHATQIARLKQRTHWPDSRIHAAIASQMPLSQKLPLADWVIWNDGSLQETQRQVRNVWEEITGSR